MIIPYRFENGKCLIRRLKSSEKASVNEISSTKIEETVEIKKDEQQKNQQEILKATSCASSDDEIDSCELIFEDDTIDSTSEPHTIEQETVTETETVETKTEVILDEEELEDDESLLEGSSVPKEMCLAKLLVEFFNFIAYEINYEKEVISIRERKLTRGSLNLGVKRIAVQDPFNPTKNAARTMSSPANFEFWKAKLRVTYGRLFIGPNELRKMIHANKFEHIKAGIERVELQVLRDREPDNKLVEVKSDAGLEVFVEDGETELTDKVSKLNLDSGKERKRGSVKLNPRLLNHINNYIAADKSRTPSPKISPRDATSSPILTSEKQVVNPSAEDDLETPRPSEESTVEESKATSDEDDDSGSSDGNEDSNNDTGSELDYEPSEVIASVCSKLQSINDPIFKRMTAVFDRECVATGPLPKRLCGLCRSENCLGDNCPDDIERVRLEELPEMKTTDYAWLDGVLMKIYRIKKPSEKEVNQRERALKFIQNFMEMNFDKNSRLELFGSSRNGFGFSGSDLDICLTFAGHDAEPPEMYSDAVDVIKGVAAAFKSNSFFSNIVAITQAKVPIVKFDLHLDNSLKFEADISYYNVLAKRNTKLLRTYCLLDSRCEVLGYLVKAMVKEVGIGDASRGSLSSYGNLILLTSG
jgi:DNA polymerase sigma